MGGEGDVRDIVEIGIGTCLTVFLITVTEWLSDLVTEQIIEMLSHLKIK